MKRNFTAVRLLTIFLLLLPALQSAEALEVRSDPPGAEILLDGDAEVTGITPATFNYPLQGRFRLEVSLAGYETYSTDLSLDPSHPLQVDVKLSPKTPMKATLRSMLIPGWGQYYTGQKTKSFAMGLMFGGAVVAYISLNQEFHSQREEYIDRLREYDRALANGADYDQLFVLHGAMFKAQEKAYDAETTRRVAAAVTAGIWGLNVIDALLFGPKTKAFISVKGVTVAPTGSGNQLGLRLTKAF